MKRNTDAIFKALGDSTRRLILDELSVRNAQTMYELTVRLISNHGLSLTRQAIAKHLAALEEAELVTSEKQGKYRVVIFHHEPLIGLLDQWTDLHHSEEEDK